MSAPARHSILPTSIQNDSWLLWQSGCNDPALNMAFDEALLIRAQAARQPLLRFYGWNCAAATFGISQRIQDVELLTPLRPLIRRPTGGGIVPHDHDWTYSLAFPPGHGWYELRASESYRLVHEWISLTWAQLGISTSLYPRPRQDKAGQCFVGAEQFDVMWQESKIAGAAQRRNHHGLLIQGSIQPQPRTITREQWEDTFCATLASSDHICWQSWEPSSDFLELASDLRNRKYSQDSYNRKR